MSKKSVHLCQDLNQTIFHCDIKLENIIFDRRSLKAALIDFDMSLEIDPANSLATTVQFRGTFGYHAPELLTGENASQNLYCFDEKTEVFAFGKTLEKWFGLDLDMDDRPSLTLFKQDHISAEEAVILQLIGNMTHVNKNQRSSLTEVRETLSSLMTPSSRYELAM